MTREDERLDADEAKAGRRVLAWFRIPVSRRKAKSGSRPERPAQRQSRIVGTVICVVYAVVWLFGWTNPSWWTSEWGSIFTINDRPPIPVELPAHRGGKFLPWGLAGLFTFLAAPFLRTQGRSAQLISALGTVGLCAEGAWLVLRGFVTAEGAVSLGQAVLWLVVPLGIAAWLLLGPPNPEAELRAALMYEERRSPLAILVIVGAASVFLFVVATLILFRLPFP